MLVKELYEFNTTHIIWSRQKSIVFSLYQENARNMQRKKSK